MNTWKESNLPWKKGDHAASSDLIRIEENHYLCNNLINEVVRKGDQLIFLSVK